MKAIFTLLLCGFLFGCSASGPLYKEVSINNEEAVLYIFRPDSTSMVVQESYIYVNGKLAVKLKNNGYTYIKISPGVHTIEQLWEVYADAGMMNKKRLSIEVNASVGSEVYVEMKSLSETGFQKVEFEWSLTELSPDIAKELIKNNRYQKSFFSQ